MHFVPKGNLQASARVPGAFKKTIRRHRDGQEVLIILHFTGRGLAQVKAGTKWKVRPLNRTGGDKRNKQHHFQLDLLPIKQTAEVDEVQLDASGKVQFVKKRQKKHVPPGHQRTCRPRTSVAAA